MAIDLSGSGTLALWLGFGSLDLPVRGPIVPWSVAVMVFAMGRNTKDEKP